MDFLNNYNIILASQSPRRKQLLEGMGFDFTVMAKDIHETYPDNLPFNQVAEYLAQLKSDVFNFDDLPKNSLIITADTIVTIDNFILGKPLDAKDAFTMLKKLSGKKHEVITGVCIQSISQKKSFSTSTYVYFKPLNDDEINYYINTYKPYDKAGAYGIQEWIGYIGIERVEGSYYNVMGLPTKRLYEELCTFVSL